MGFMLRCGRSVFWLGTAVALLGLLYAPPLFAADEPAPNPLVLPIPENLVALFAGGSPKGVDDLRAMEDHTRKLAEKLIPCTVGVQIGPAWGSGVIISKDGYVLTAAHVSGQPNRDVTFVFPDGKTKRGKTLGLNRTLDAGLMKINDNKTEFTHAEMAQAGHLKEGQWCVATGHPGGYFPDRKPVLRLGRILFYDREAVTTDCTLVGGDSGGPLFDMEGRVIGINSRISSELKSNMHVPIAAFREDWERMTKAQAWGHFPGQEPFIGVRGEPNVETAKIAHLVSGGPADKAGLKVGDVVKKFNGQDITDFASLTAKVRDCQPTDRVKLTVQRGEEQLDVFVIVGRKGN